MSKELPAIFKNPSNKAIDNNKRVFYSRYDSIGNVVEREEDKEIDLSDAVTFNDALNNLFKNNQFVFNVPVEIITKNETINSKIVSKVGDHLLTASGKVIKLEDILSVRIKDN